MSVIQGAYSATWNGLSVGNTEQGFEMSYMQRARPVQFDAIGETAVDMLFSGLVMTVDAILTEYDADAINTMLWPWHASRGVAPVAGRSLWDLAQPLILTRCAGLTINPVTVTYHKAILAPDYALRTLFSGTRPRYVPFQWYIFPIQPGTQSSPQRLGTCQGGQYFVMT